MTKLEHLRNSTSTEKIYTWKTLGSCTITDSTKIYSTDIIYYVDIPTSSLNGYLIYCKKEFIGNIDWLRGTLLDYDYGEITFGNSIVSPNFTVLLTYNEFNEVNQESEQFVNGYKSFEPFKNMNSNGKVKISEEDYRRCVSCLGYPFISEDELEFTREEITEYAIKPALEEYFHWIPATVPVEATVDVNGSIIDMPSDCYTVVGLSLQQYGGASNGNLMSPMFYGMEQSLYSGFNYTNLTGTYNGMSSPKTQMNSFSNAISSRASAQALINYTRRVHYEGPYTRADGSRYVKVWSNTMGNYNVWFGRRTLDFNDVEYAHRTRVFDYAQANVKEMFATLRSQSKSDIPGLVDYKEWLSEAKTTKEKITSEYKAIVKASGVLRGSL